MDIDQIDLKKFLNSESAKKSLIKLLQNAHAGEKAAANAYWGHAHSPFIRNKEDRIHILKIYADEIHHRIRLAQMLNELGAKPRVSREILMYTIGLFIGFFSYWGTWFIPMFGAGVLESSNIGEYEVAARLAFLSGKTDLVQPLLIFAEVEHDHEVFFRTKIQSHFYSKRFPLWKKPKEKHMIQKSMNEFTETYKKTLLA